MMQKLRLPHALSCLAVLALSGCGSGSGAISGKVTYKDKPLAGGAVTFMTSDQRVKTGIIGADGNYSIEGVAAGPVRIGVYPPSAPAKMPAGMKMNPSKMGGTPADGDAAATTDAKPPALPQKYQDPETSGLTYTVTSGKQQHNIELK